MHRQSYRFRKDLGLPNQVCLFRQTHFNAGRHQVWTPSTPVLCRKRKCRHRVTRHSTRQGGTTSRIPSLSCGRMPIKPLPISSSHLAKSERGSGSVPACDFVSLGWARRKCRVFSFGGRLQWVWRVVCEACQKGRLADRIGKSRWAADSNSHDQALFPRQRPVRELSPEVTLRGGRVTFSC